MPEEDKRSSATQAALANTRSRQAGAAESGTFRPRSQPSLGAADWELIQRAYTTTQEPLRGIAKRFQVHHQVIRRRAASRSWVRPKSPTMQQMAEAAAGTMISPDQQTVQQVLASVISDQRVLAQKGQVFAGRVLLALEQALDDVEAATDHLVELRRGPGSDPQEIAKAAKQVLVSAGAAAASFQRWANGAAAVMRTERIAWGMDGDSERQPTKLPPYEQLMALVPFASPLDSSN